MNPTNPINPSNSSSQALWYVIHTKPGNEDRVRTNLQNQEIETFSPLLETYQYCNGRMIPKIKPLFPNYLFARLDLELHYYKVKWTRGVNKILGSRNEPVSISAKVIETIKGLAGTHGFEGVALDADVGLVVLLLLLRLIFGLTSTTAHEGFSFMVLVLEFTP